jgi:hypothetical protein
MCRIMRYWSGRCFTRPTRKDTILGSRSAGQALVNFVMSRDEAARLLVRANEIGLSRSELLRRLISDFLGKPNDTHTTG